MTIRSGGRPRDRRAAPAPTYDPDAYATDTIPEFSEPIPRQRGGGRGGGGLIGFLKFLIFALVLAAIVLAVALTALRPAVGTAVMAVADDNPAVLQLPFVADIVRENLGTALTTPASTDPAQVEFLVESGDSAKTIAMRLQSEGLLSDDRTFIFIATTDGLTGSLQAGTFVLRKNMTPDQLVVALLKPPAVPFVDIALRTSLRLEQVTAKLESLTSLQMDASEFYEIAKSPPPELLADYPWLAAALKDAPKGASLEGFLWPATYRVLPDTTPEELIRLMLDKFASNVGPDRMAVAKDRGLNFYQVITMASIVEKEAQLDEEKALIAGVYSNRLDPKKWPTGLLQSDPTIFYIHDTLELAKLKVPDWTKFVFWAPIKGGLTDEELPPDLAGYNTYTSAGLPPGPISTPTLASIDAALEPDTKDGYLFFVAKGDGSKTTAFAKTLKQHQANVKKYVKPAP